MVRFRMLQDEKVLVELFGGAVIIRGHQEGCEVDIARLAGAPCRVVRQRVLRSPESGPTRPNDEQRRPPGKN